MDGQQQMVTITYEPQWRASYWNDTVASREAWFVTCSEHPGVGEDSNGEPWGYAAQGTARNVASRHRTAYHGGQR